MGWGVFNDQFRETEFERQLRWAKRKRELTAEGKCWQCGDPVDQCLCPNLNHQSTRATKK